MEKPSTQPKSHPNSKDTVASESAVEEQKIELIAQKTLKANEELYKIVDFLNKSLKGQQIMFGLTKNSHEDTMTIKIYNF